MPLSLVSVMVLRETIRPFASNETTAVVAIFVKILPEMSPETCSSQMPLPPLSDISQSTMRTSLPTEAMHQAAPLRQRNAAAIEGDAGQADAVGAFALQHRSAAAEHEFGRAAHADQLRAVRKPQHAGAIDARRQRQRHLRARGLVDRALQFCGLVVGTAGTHAILRDVAAERGGERRRARRRRATSPARRRRRRRMLQ